VRREPLLKNEVHKMVKLKKIFKKIIKKIVTVSICGLGLSFAAQSAYSATAKTIIPLINDGQGYNTVNAADHARGQNMDNVNVVMHNAVPEPIILSLLAFAGMIHIIRRKGASSY
jgi:alkaline phosphatase